MSADPSSPQQPAAPLDLTPGQLLAAARKEHHMSLGDVANRLKLSVAQVEALEDDAYDRLPGPVFVRGFIRNYARLVRLDSDRLLRAVNTPADAEEAREKSKRSLELPLQPERRWPRYVAFAAAIFAIAGTIDFLWPESPTKIATSDAPVPPKETVQASTEPSAQPAAPGAIPPVTGESAQGAGAVTTMQGTVTMAAAQRADAAAPTPPANAISAAPASEGRAAPRNDDTSAESRAHVRLAFTEPSWVEVRDRDGRVILSQLNSPGTTREVNGSAPFKLIIGNARGVRLMFNDQPVDLSRYTRVDVARLTLE